LKLIKFIEREMGSIDMNKNCKLCGGTFDFRKVYISKCLNETDIAFPGNLLQVNKNNCFTFCPACGKKLSRENFNGEDVLEEDSLEEAAQALKQIGE
jgi:hypothetical protein